jgi:transcriptional regulator of arginine metabolism
MKKDRQLKIIELIKSKPIETQEELQQELTMAGYDVTQATVSRDIKELRIVKMLDDSGIYRYAVNSAHGGSKAPRHRELFSRTVVSVDYAVNNVVIKCHVGMAQGACASLDSMHFPNVLGTLAGDDTILVITKTELDAENLCLELKAIIE